MVGFLLQPYLAQQKNVASIFFGMGSKISGNLNLKRDFLASEWDHKRFQVISIIFVKVMAIKVIFGLIFLIFFFP